MPRLNKHAQHLLLNIAKQPLRAAPDSRAKSRVDFADRIAKERIAGIERWYAEGGEWFVKWTRRYYKKWSGEPLEWTEPYLSEFYLLMGTPQIERVIVEKPAQVGFSECLIAMSAFLLAAVRIPIAMGFEREGKLRDMVAPRIQPAYDFITPIVDSRKARWEATRRPDIDFQQRKLSVAGVELTFFYTSTATKVKDKRQASSAMSSFSAWVILGDEIELWSEGSLDVATERQSACTMPTKPFRAGSTPGQEGGIVDAQVKQSGYIFEWKLTCPHCQTQQAIDAFGNLLKPVEQVSDDGTIEIRHVDQIGRPLDWFCHDSSSRDARINTAYVGCSNPACGKELGWKAITQGCFETKAGVKLKEFCTDAVTNQTPVFTPVAIRLPRLASKLFSPSERIRKLLTTSNPGDQLQQGLGKAVSVGGGKIALPRLLKCVQTIPPARKPDLIVMGVDQGRSANWGMVQRWWMGSEGDWEQRWLDAFKEIIWYGEITGFSGIDALVEQYDVDLVGIDNEPEVQLAAAYARKHLPFGTEITELDATGDDELANSAMQPRSGVVVLSEERKGQVYLFDQVVMKGEDFKRTTRTVQRVKVPVYAVHRSFGLDAVRNRIYRNLQRFPDGTTYLAGDGYNLLYHYLTSDRQSDGHWTAMPNAPDHWLHADNFCEVVTLCSHYEVPETGFYFGSLNRE